MPTRPLTRDQGWILPRAIGELVPPEHLARFIAKLIEDLDVQTRQVLRLDHVQRYGAPSYSSAALLSAWIYGFQVGIRSTRQLAVACREWVPLMWLVGEVQPDHVTLWRFYDARRGAMRDLLKHMVYAAIEGGLLDLSMQVVDGTKVEASASRSHMRDAAALAALDQQLTQAITEMEARAEAEAKEGTTPVRVAAKLRVANEKRDRTRAALERLQPTPAKDIEARPGEERAGSATEAHGQNGEPTGDAATPTAAGSVSATERTADAAPSASTPSGVLGGTNSGPDGRSRAEPAGKKTKKKAVPKANLTDPDATLMKGRHNTILPGYNAEIASVGLADGVLPGERGHFIVGAYVTTAANDVAELLPILDVAATLTGQRTPLTLADSGFHSGSNLVGADARGQRVWMPDTHDTDAPYFKDRFVYDPEADTYRCPQGKLLRRAGIMERTRNQPDGIRYRAGFSDCKACPARTACGAGKTHGRSIVFGPYDDRLKQHRAVMRDPAVQERYKQRKWRVEPIFGKLKELQRCRRFLHRGLEKVNAEWTLHAVAFNLKTFYRIWRSRTGAARTAFLAMLTTGMGSYRPEAVTAG